MKQTCNLRQKRFIYAYIIASLFRQSKTLLSKFEFPISIQNMKFLMCDKNHKLNMLFLKYQSKVTDCSLICIRRQFYFGFSLWRIWLILLFLIDYSTAASSLVVEERIRSKLNFAEFELFDSIFVKKYCRDLYSQMAVYDLTQKKVRYSFLDNSIALKYALIADWNKFINDDKQRHKFTNTCKSIVFKLKEQKENKHNTKRFKISAIDDCITCITKLIDVLSKDTDEDFLNEDDENIIFSTDKRISAKSNNNTKSIFMNTITSCISMNKLGMKNLVVREISMPVFTDMIDKYKYIRSLNRLNFYNAFKFLESLFLLITTVADILEVSIPFNMSISRDIETFTQYLYVSDGLNLGYKFECIFDNFFFIFFLKKLAQPIAYTKAEYIEKFNYLKKKYHLRGSTDKINNDLRLKMTIKTFQLVYNKCLFMHSLQCYLLFAINFYSKEIYDLGMITDLMNVMLKDNTKTDGEILKYFSQFVHKVNKMDLKLMISPETFYTKEASFYDKNIRLLQQECGFGFIPKNFYSYFQKMAGILTINFLKIDMNKEYNLVTDEVLVCLNDFIDDNIYKNSHKCDIERNRILKNMIAFYGNFLYSTKNTKALEKHILRPFILSQYKSNNNTIIEFYSCLSIDSIVDDIAKLKDINEAKIMIFFFDIILLYDLLSGLRRYTLKRAVINVSNLRKVFISKLSEYFPERDLYWPTMCHKHDI